MMSLYFCANTRFCDFNAQSPWVDQTFDLEKNTNVVTSVGCSRGQNKVTNVKSATAPKDQVILSHVELTCNPSKHVNCPKCPFCFNVSNSNVVVIPAMPI